MHGARMLNPISNSPSSILRMSCSMITRPLILPCVSSTGFPLPMSRLRRRQPRSRFRLPSPTPCDTVKSLIAYAASMKPNLDILKPEIELYLEESGLAIFYGFSRPLESSPAVFWDCDQYPDYRQFVQSAHAAGVKLIVFHQREFFSEQIDEALEKLHSCELPSQESRHFEERLNDFRMHEGSVCAIELSFDHQGRIY